MRTFEARISPDVQLVRRYHPVTVRKSSATTRKYRVGLRLHRFDCERVLRHLQDRSGRMLRCVAMRYCRTRSVAEAQTRDCSFLFQARYGEVVKDGKEGKLNHLR